MGVPLVQYRFLLADARCRIAAFGEPRHQCAALLAILLASSTTTLAQESLHALESASFAPRMFRIDPSSGSVVGTTGVSHVKTFISGLAFDGSRFFSVDGLNQTVADDLFQIRPIDGLGVTIGLTGFDWNFRSLDVDPSSGVCFGLMDQGLYKIDLSTGVAVLIGAVQHNKQGEFLRSFAIAPNGTAYACGSWLWTVDLQTGNPTYLGPLNTSWGSMVSGYFWDMAFNSVGELWGSHQNTLGSGRNGLYRVDLASMTAVQVKHVQPPYVGIAFAPDMDGEVYCSPKLGWTGCFPTISAKGIPTTAVAQGYTISCDGARNSRAGALALSVNGQASLPFAGGTLCVASPYRISPVQSSGGAVPPIEDCSGMWSLDFNAFLALHPVVDAGTTVCAQWFGRDPGAPFGFDYQLSDALTFIVMP